MSSGGTPGSRSIRARLKCGTGLGRPPDCEHLFFNANGEPSGVWRGDHNLPTHEQGITILGTALGHEDFVRGQLDEKNDKHEVLLDKISKVPDLQCAWRSCCAPLPSKLCAPGCPSCVVFPIRADARRWDQGVLPDALARSSHTTHVGNGKSSTCVGRSADGQPRIGPVGQTLSLCSRARHPDVADHMLVSLSRCGWNPLGGSQ